VSERRGKVPRRAGLAPNADPNLKQGSIMSRIPVRPFLIAKDENGDFRLTVRETRFNSQGYPLVTSILQDETFPTATAARNHAKVTFGAETGQFAAK
jgi:hypothetical protein